MSNTILFALVCGVAGVIYGIMTAMWVNKQDSGNQKMIDISNAVKEGANAFLAREYKTVAVVAVILLVAWRSFPPSVCGQQSDSSSARWVPPLPASSACGCRSALTFVRQRQPAKASRPRSASRSRAAP